MSPKTTTALLACFVALSACLIAQQPATAASDPARFAAQSETQVPASNIPRLHAVATVVNRAMRPETEQQRASRTSMALPWLQALMMSLLSLALIASAGKFRHPLRRPRTRV